MESLITQKVEKPYNRYMFFSRLQETSRIASCKNYRDVKKSQSIMDWDFSIYLFHRTVNATAAIGWWGWVGCWVWLGFDHWGRRCCRSDWVGAWRRGSRCGWRCVIVILTGVWTGWGVLIIVVLGSWPGLGGLAR